MRYRLLGLALCLWLTGCSQPQPPFSNLTGELTGPTRLPAGSRAQIILEEIGPADRAALRVAEMSQPAEATPIRFQLSYQPSELTHGHYYNVRARIEDANGGLIWTTDRAYPLPADGAPMRIALTPVAPPPVQFDCDGLALQASFGPEQVRLRLAQEHWTLSQVRSASGGHYRNEKVEFWTKGNEARLRINQSETVCTLVP